MHESTAHDRGYPLEGRASARRRREGGPDERRPIGRDAHGAQVAKETGIVRGIHGPHVELPNAESTQTIRPSAERRKSPSIASACWSQARRKAASVFSGASADAPRWAVISCAPAGVARSTGSTVKRASRIVGEAGDPWIRPDKTLLFSMAIIEPPRAVVPARRARTSSIPGRPRPCEARPFPGRRGRAGSSCQACLRLS
jgi:hypothetical protein